MRRIIAWGSYDTSKPRVRLLLAELRAQKLLDAEINIPVWAEVRDKAVAGKVTILKSLLRLLVGYPAALIKLLGQPPNQALLLPYPGIPDIFLAWVVARLRGHKVLLDAFIAIHDTIVADRHMVSAYGLVSRLLWKIERAALRLADIIVVDTDQHAEFFAKEFGIVPDRFQTIMVGAESAFWDSGRIPAHHPQVPHDKPVVLFYGQLIPLHGVETILEAIRLTAGERLHWMIIGSGQEESKLKLFFDRYCGGNVSWHPWVDYRELPSIISAVSVCLGIFGSSNKAGRVIPNKLFQILAVGKPVITRAGPAINAVASRYRGAIVTVPAGDALALADAVRRAIETQPCEPQCRPTSGEFGPGPGVAELSARLASG